MKSALALAGITLLAGTGLAVTTTAASAAPPSDPNPSLLAAADSALKQNAAAIRGSAKDGYSVYSSKADSRLGGGVVRYTRTYDGLRVYGGDLIIRTGANGDLAGASAGLDAPLNLSTSPAYPSNKARSTATATFKGKVTSTGKPELFVDASSGKGRLAWETVVTGMAPDGQTPSKLHVIVDAGTGAAIGSFDDVETVVGTGTGLFTGTVNVDTTLSGSTYRLVDPVRGGGSTCDMNNGTSTCTVFTDPDNVWGTGTNANRQSAGIDAHVGAEKTFDYYLNVHGRNGIFGDGRGVPSRVHYGSNYVNAFWDDTQMTYGDGSGNAHPLVAIDVAGHEMSHGVTDNIVAGGLTYSGESGGLNEATSDIFGNMVEFYADSSLDPGDYEVGEKIDINGDGTPLRYMYNPALDGTSHSCWSTSTGGVDVHYSSGVANHFFFDLAEGTGATAFGTSPLCGSAPPVTGIGRAKAEKIWFRALDLYFTSNTGYVNNSNPTNTARAASLSAAADLYGLCGTEYKAVQSAWTAVNVAGPDADNCVANNFSLSATPGTVTVDPGESATATVNTTVVAGTPEQVTFTAAGVPAGVTVTFNPPSVTAGESTTATISTTSAVGSGSYAITLAGTSPSVTRSATVNLTVNGLPGCSGSNETDFAIKDNTTIESSIVISGCAGTPSSASQVAVDITHTWIGDLVVTLIAPDGTSFVLHNREGGSTDNIKKTYASNLSGESANGVWKLRVQDAASADTGTLNRWALSL